MNHAGKPRQRSPIVSATAWCGAFSSFVHEQLKPGDVLEVMTPMGSFCTPLHPLNEKHYVAIAAGSGITPVLSMLQTTMEIETESR